MERRIEDEREAEPGADAVLALKDEPRVVVEELQKIRGVRAADLHHAIELRELLKANRSTDFERPDVVTRKNEAIGLEEIVGRARAKRRIRRQVARPAMIA